MGKFIKKGTELQGLEGENTLGLLSELNKQDYTYLIFDILDNVHKRENLVMFDVEEIHNNSGVENIFIMGRFNERYKECLKLSKGLLKDLLKESVSA